MVVNFREEIINKNLDKLQSLDKIKNLVPSEEDF